MIKRAWNESKEMSTFLSHVQKGAAWVKFREGHMAEAIDLMSEALSKESSEYPDVYLSSLLTNLHTEIAMASGEYEKALSLVNANIQSMQDGNRNLFHPDALHIKAKVLMQMEKKEEGLKTLMEAKELAERINSRRGLVFILGTLLEVAKESRDFEEVEVLQVQGKEIASFISDHITDPDLKRSFLNLEEVRSFYE